MLSNIRFGLVESVMWRTVDAVRIDDNSFSDIVRLVRFLNKYQSTLHIIEQCLHYKKELRKLKLTS